MIKEKTFYKSFMVLALSLALQNLLTYGVNMMDTLMLGRYSQDAMGGVSLCNQIQYLLQMLVVGAGEGAVVMGSQYWGKKKLEPIPNIIGVALRFAAHWRCCCSFWCAAGRRRFCSCSRTTRRSSRRARSISALSASPT